MTVANLTGGDITFSGNISRGVKTGAGAVTATVNLAGADLDMGGNSIGASGAPVTLDAQSGSILGLAELNGGGTLTKTTPGTLTLGNGNLYTGGTNVTAGTLLANNTGGSATGTGTLSVDLGATLGGDGIIAPSANELIIVDGDVSGFGFHQPVTHGNSFRCSAGSRPARGVGYYPPRRPCPGQPPAIPICKPGARP